MQCENESQARTLNNRKGWQKVGFYYVCFATWNPEDFQKNMVVPSYGGWLKVCDLHGLMDSRKFQAHR